MNLACVDDSNGICSRPHINPTSYSHPLQLSLTPDGTHNGGTALEPLSTGNSSVNATAQSFYIRITADTEKITEPTKVYYYCEEHPNMGGILNIIPCESTPTPIAQQDPTPTPTNGNGGTDDSGDTNGGGSNNDGETDGGDGNLSSSPIVSVSGEYCTSDTTPTWTINYDTSYPHPIEYEVKINSDGEVFTITEQSYTAPNTLEHERYTLYVRGKSAENRWSDWKTSRTEVRTHMPNVPVLFHEKSHARFGSTQAINSQAS